MEFLTRELLSNVLDAQMQTRTIKSNIIDGTFFEDWEINENWIVVLIKINKNNILEIECVPEEYMNR